MKCSRIVEITRSTLKSPLYNNKGQSAAMKALSTLNKQMGEIATLQLNSSDSDAQH